VLRIELARARGGRRPGHRLPVPPQRAARVPVPRRLPARGGRRRDQLHGRGPTPALAGGRRRVLLHRDRGERRRRRRALGPGRLRCRSRRRGPTSSGEHRRPAGLNTGGGFRRRLA
jgi:hypothetical protein